MKTWQRAETYVTRHFFYLGISHFFHALADVAAQSRKNLLARYFYPFTSGVPMERSCVPLSSP